MYSPQYLRHRHSNATTEDESLKGLPISSEDDDRENFVAQRERDEERLRLAGLRRRNLLLLFAWLIFIALLALLLLMLHISLVHVLQMSPRGMRSLRIFKYEDIQSGKSEPAVHFTADSMHLGQVVAKSGQVLGPRHGQLGIHGSRVLISAGNGTKATFQEGECRLEGAENFQVRQSTAKNGNGGGGKVLFSARHPLFALDRRIKRIASGHIVTNKLRAPIDESMQILAEDLGLRGNERIQLEASAVHLKARTGIRLLTSDDGSLRMNSGHIYLGNKWLSLPLSSSPALIASVDAFRVCLCNSRSFPERPKLFLVPGNKPCAASATVCQ